MPLVVIGVLLLVAKLAEFGPFATWSWWVVLAPFAGAMVWWSFADNSGWTQRRVMEKMERKKADRRDKAMDALGLTSRRERHATRSREDTARRNSAGKPADPPKRERGS